jgi:hypothetical protein
VSHAALAALALAIGWAFLSYTAEHCFENVAHSIDRTKDGNHDERRTEQKKQDGDRNSDRGGIVLRHKRRVEVGGHLRSKKKRARSCCEKHEALSAFSSSPKRQAADQIEKRTCKDKQDVDPKSVK